MRTALIAIAIVAFSWPAAGQQQNCGPTADALAALKKQYNEVPVGVGLSSDGTLLQLLTSKDGATWTVLMSSPNGVSCMVDDGENWQIMPSDAESEGGPEL